MAMDITNYFIESATQADGELRNLAGQQLSNLERKKVLAQIESRLEEMAADGVLDEGEMKELSARFKAAGLDDRGLMQLYNELKGADASVRGDNVKKLESLISGKIDDAENLVSDNQADLNFKIQLTMDEFTNGIDGASRLMKAEHDAYMVAIRHLVA